MVDGRTETGRSGGSLNGGVSLQLPATEILLSTAHRSGNAKHTFQTHPSSGAGPSFSADELLID